jgi:hypothetical protein
LIFFDLILSLFNCILLYKIQIYFIKKHEIILEDYTIDGKFIFDLECISPNAKIFKMENKVKKYLINYN